MIRFLKYTWLYAVVSAVVIVPGMVAFVTRGLKPSIDFAGGTLVDLRVSENVDQKQIEDKAAELGIELATIQKSGDSGYLLRTTNEYDRNIPELVAALNREATDAATLVRHETVGPVLGRELLVKAVVAALIAVVAILAYVAYAFRNINFGLAAVVALLHDVMVMIGCFSLFGILFSVEVDTLFVTAILTTMSFSVHDTIVVFDRIREYERKNSRTPFEEISDRALTETMGRSLANSVTIIIMLLALVLMSGESIRWFAIALLIGTVSGTYSSPFVATPVLNLIRKLRRK